MIKKREKMDAHAVLTLSCFFFSFFYQENSLVRKEKILFKKYFLSMYFQGKMSWIRIKKIGQKTDGERKTEEKLPT